jgi:hypothetical protein
MSLGLPRRDFLLAGGVAVAGVATKCSCAELEPQRDHADLVIWDSTPAGLVAAVAAARGGLSVTVVTEDKHIGGLQTSGLGWTNAGQIPTIGGLAREFHRRVLKHYIDKYGADSQPVLDSKEGFRFEPHVAERVYFDWLREAGVRVAVQEVIAGVDKTGSTITAIRTAGGRRFAGRMFLDASYEGDLLALAGCSFHLGRESRAKYGESLAGVTYPPARAGEEDHKLQPFDYRCCLTDVKENQTPFAEPPDYNPGAYAWLMRHVVRDGTAGMHNIVPLNLMPHGKTDSRTAEWPGHSWDYIEASRARRAEVEKAHRYHSAGFLYFLATDKSVPKVVQEEARRWGLAKDEFTDNGNWPWHIYVREGRRLVGEYVMRQRDLVDNRFKSDGIGLCSWYMDVHPVEVVRDGDHFHADGYVHQSVQPFEIPYRSLLPQSAEADNLLVPVALSASHVAFSSIRVEPVWMILGHACGVAIAQSLADEGSLHRLSTDKLRRQLVDQGQVIDAHPFNDFWPKKPD